MKLHEIPSRRLFGVFKTEIVCRTVELLYKTHHFGYFLILPPRRAGPQQRKATCATVHQQELQRAAAPPVALDDPFSQQRAATTQTELDCPFYSDLGII